MHYKGGILIEENAEFISVLLSNSCDCNFYIHILLVDMNESLQPG